MARKPSRKGGKKWIQKAVKRPGRITKACGGKPSCECIDRLSKNKNKSLASAARLAKRFKGCKGTKPISRKRK